jgi:serine/threonine protein kinase
VSGRHKQVLGKLGNHPNIVTVLERWEECGTAFMTSRYLPGGSLSGLIAGYRERRTSLPAEDILRIATEIARGLVHVHEQRILYRDLQPRNALFDAPERDFEVGSHSPTGRVRDGRRPSESALRAESGGGGQAVRTLDERHEPDGNVARRCRASQTFWGPYGGPWGVFRSRP